MVDLRGHHLGGVTVIKLGVGLVMLLGLSGGGENNRPRARGNSAASKESTLIVARCLKHRGGYATLLHTHTVPQMPLLCA
jgi:hypothetical protein